MITTELQSAAIAILQALDFGGNSREALASWEEENRELTNEERCDAFVEAQRLWNEAKESAGVPRPIHSHERRRIERAFR